MAKQSEKEDVSSMIKEILSADFTIAKLTMPVWQWCMIIVGYYLFILTISPSKRKGKS